MTYGKSKCLAIEIVDFPSYKMVDLSIVIMVIIHGILIWLVVQ